MPGALSPSRVGSIYPLYIIIIDANIINILQFEFPARQIKSGLNASFISLEYKSNAFKDFIRNFKIK
jgi:hypothetical protein